MSNQPQKSVISKHLVIALVGALVAYFLIQGLVDSRFSHIEQSTRIVIAEQEKLMTAVAETMARNGADTVTESIVKDCSTAERNEFDTLLGNLNNGLSNTQLTQLERLFGRCGGFFANRKAVMSARLTREIEVFEQFISQLSVVTGADASTEYRLKMWQELAAAEHTQSTLFSELVEVQDQIITALLGGNDPDSNEVAAILQRAGEVQQSLLVANEQAKSLRADLVSL